MLASAAETPVLRPRNGGGVLWNERNDNKFHESERGTESEAQ